ncbi:glycosyltransferase [Aeromonas veronii]|uniref:glycosyltransferase n=1 Tax=Aeromonas veronii TaxID=654 RepID=UPI003550D5FB
MNNKKMAIVSSYSESCGNASFTKILHDGIESFYKNIKVEVLELDLKLLQSVNKNVRKKADKHIDELCHQLKAFDCANIQMEAGLYGTLPQDIIKRFYKLVSANKNTSVTLHSPRLISSTPNNSRGGIKKILQLNVIGGLKELLTEKRGNIHLNINKKIIEYSIENKARLIVHTSRAKKQIQDFFSYSNVSVHPLKMVPDNYVENKNVLKDIRNYLDLSDADVTIGMFGYISSYKGHSDALNALKLLPDNYKLLIFGRQHPQTLKANGVVDSYLNTLIQAAVNNKKLKNRVFFLGELNDQEFLDVASSIDIAWLPYYENGQDGSGIASICMDLSPRVLCSSSFAFDELFKLVKYNNVMRFDIGNISEIALKTKMILKKNELSRPYASNDLYSIKTQSDIYVQELTS